MVQMFVRVSGCPSMTSVAVDDFILRRKVLSPVVPGVSAVTVIFLDVSPAANVTDLADRL